MRNILLVTFILFSIQSHGQKIILDNVIEMNTKFALELQSTDSLGYTYKIISKEPFVGELESSNAKKYFSKDTAKNHIQGIIARGAFGGSINTILIVQNGLDKSIRYKLKIKVPQRRKPLNTSVVDLYPKVPSIELWPYTIEYVQFYGFVAAPELEDYVFEPRVDSSCIKNRAKNIVNSNELFIKHLKLSINGFKEGKLFELSELLQFEDSIEAEDVSLGHYWSLSEGIYPNNNKYIFSNPISYRRLECPCFEGVVTYFCTKKENSIKVVSYEWKEFKERDFPIATSTICENKKKTFEEKYDLVLAKLSDFLGNPISDTSDEDGRRQTKWMSKDSINAYLFNFSSINEIRLYFYKE
jgi:hypothetical protein